MMEKIDLKKFEFKILDDNENEDFTYLFRFGNFEFKCQYTTWSNDLSNISKAFNSYTREGQCKISLNYDTEPFELLLKKESDGILKVTIEPSLFFRLSKTDGYVNEKMFLRKLYDGLLFGSTYHYDEDGCGWHWDECKMVRYNATKSRIIEEYLRTSARTEASPYVVKHVLIYNGSEILHVCDETIGYHIPIKREMPVFNKEGQVIASINGEDIVHNNYLAVVDTLPTDFDFWVVSKDNDNFITPRRIERTLPNEGVLFEAVIENYPELGMDKYGFTSKSLYQACKEDLDFEKIKRYLSIGADTTFLFSWILRSNSERIYDRYDHPKYIDEKSMRELDSKKAEIISWILNNYPEIIANEYNLFECIWYYCPKCLKLFLASGTNPNEGKFIKYPIKVKYRSALNRLLLKEEEENDKYGFLAEMKASLLSYGAKDIVIWNEEYPE